VDHGAIENIGHRRTEQLSCALDKAVATGCRDEKSSRAAKSLNLKGQLRERAWPEQDT
jgi:hypothetical protein